jgi:hypothetical protein
MLLHISRWNNGDVFVTHYDKHVLLPSVVKLTIAVDVDSVSTDYIEIPKALVKRREVYERMRVRQTLNKEQEVIREDTARKKRGGKEREIQ